MFDGEARALGVPSLYPRTPASAPAPPRVTETTNRNPSVTVALRPRRDAAKREHEDAAIHSHDPHARLCRRFRRRLVETLPSCL